MQASEIGAAARDRRKRLRSLGLEQAEADAMFARYEGACWICRVRPAVVIDHDHTTGVVRGAACHTCNGSVLAKADADPEFLARVTAYLDEASGATNFLILLRQR